VLKDLLFLLGDRRFSGLETDLTVGTVTERLGDRPTAAAQREPGPPPASAPGNSPARLLDPDGYLVELVVAP